MKPTPADGRTLGEVMFRGNVVMKGYLKNKKSTDDAFAGGWFHSGDLGVKYPDGYVQLKDRSKDIIISGGENISSLEVEDVLYRHPAVLAAAVVAMPLLAASPRGLPEGVTVEVDIDGTTVGSGTTDGSGSATITITAPATAGTYTVTATGGGECSDVASLAIVVTTGGGLPSTGSNSTMPGLQIAIVAVLVGGALVGLASMRRRRSAAH